MPQHFRAWPRRRSDAPVLVRVARSVPEPQERRARLTDVGLGGAGLSVDEPLELGAALEVVVPAPNRWEPLVLPARVAWTEGRRAGVAFLPPSERDAYDLFELLGTQVLDT
jgi:hypothetical protein